MSSAWAAGPRASRVGRSVTSTSVVGREGGILPGGGEGRLRILHLDTAAEWRGGQQLVLRLARGMLALGDDVVVACPASGRLWRELGTSGVPRIAVPAGRSIRAALTVRRHAADVVVAHTSHAHACALAWPGPLAVHRWVDFPVSGGWKYRRPDGWAAVSGPVREILRASGARNVRVVAGGVDPLPACGPAPDAPAVLAVGARVHHKGHDVLAAAARRLPGVDVGVAGDGPIQPEGLRLLGAREDVPALLRGCRVFVMPSRSEGLGLAAIEALQAGVPVVASAVGGLPEAVGDAGILVPPGDPVALADAIRRALDGEHPQAALGIARVAARFTTERMVKESRALYAAAVAAAGR